MSRQINNIIKFSCNKRVHTTLPILALLALLLNGCAIKQPVQQPAYPTKKPSTHTTPSKRPTPSYPAPQVVQPQPEPSPQTTPATTYTPKTGAGGALYSSAQGAINRGDYQQAEMSLERALKIEPRNAHYWYSMAQVKYKQKQYSQTVHLCSKSKSLAGKNSQLISLNDDLSAKARQQL
ncbi:tetratricopeptide repeat protein [Desulfopila aestuarii]|uniref:Uncharacterized protein n=1 Tax=Desulfopila aestuarii DSM 18488 TaxID=1121416 RepID=A0A1M7XZP5_9BACT|nr:tetratricopeptide repeat protein [Desulfopila aestuarii]SHO44726.1 hypothetical protein SAMN02745220_00855 [Desulfopila aestuarii DSM 18488]